MQDFEYHNPDATHPYGYFTVKVAINYYVEKFEGYSRVSEENVVQTKTLTLTPDLLGKNGVKDTINQLLKLTTKPHTYQ